MIIALHGDFATPTMLKRDMGNLSPMVDLFWDANGWRRTDREIDRLGGSFPVLMIWNDEGVMSGKRKGQALVARQIWKASHPVTEIWGVGRHLKFGPIGHGWDCSLNDRIRDFLEACG